MPNHGSNTLTIPLKKRKILLYGLGALVFVVGGFWMIFYAKGRTFLDTFFITENGLLSVVFFGLGLIVVVVKLIDPRPGLVIDDQGIIDRSHGVSVGRIDWEDIQDIYYPVFYSQEYITIFVKYPEKYIKRGIFLLRWVRRINGNYFGSTVQIAPQFLQIDFSQLKSILETRFERYSSREEECIKEERITFLD